MNELVKTKLHEIKALLYRAFWKRVDADQGGGVSAKLVLFVWASSSPASALRKALVKPPF